MKVRELIDKLQQYDPELEVALGDWNEEYSPPNREVVKDIGVCDHRYWDEELGNWKIITSLVIG